MAEAPTEAQVEVGEEKVEVEGEVEAPVGEEEGEEVGAPEKENLSGARAGGGMVPVTAKPWRAIGASSSWLPAWPSF